MPLLSSSSSAPPTSLLEGLFPNTSFPPPKDFPIQLQIAFGDELVTGGNVLSVESVKDYPSTVNFVGEEGAPLHACSARPWSALLSSLTQPELAELTLSFSPDAPSAASPTSRSFLHSIKPNLAPLPVASLDALGSSGVDVDGPPSMVSVPGPEEDLMPWRAPGPGKGSGEHRYVFLLVKQASGERVTFSPDHKLRNGAPEGRRRFDVGTFVKEEIGEGSEVVGLTWFVVKAEE